MGNELVVTKNIFFITELKLGEISLTRGYSFLNISLFSHEVTDVVWL